MKRLGIKHQILLITLIPVLLIDTFFTATHVSKSLAQQNETLLNNGRNAAAQIVAAVELNQLSARDERLVSVLQHAIDNSDVVFATVYDATGEPVAEWRSNSYDDDELPDYFYFRQPVQLKGTTAEAAAGNGSVNLYFSRTPLRQKTIGLFIESAVFFILALIVAVLLTILISQRITKPIFRLIEHLHYVETGQLGRTIETTESNEIGALQQGFNRMSHALLGNRRHLNHRIQQATQQLNEAITDLESRNRELGFARDMAQDANRTKSKFLANMSHEIRTPINGIKGFLGLLNRSRLDASQQRYVDIILKSTNDLTAIVDEILDFSKMESGKLHIVEESFDLYEVIEQTRDILFINALAKDIDLNLIIFSDTPKRVLGDKLRLKQILLNLIGNAIKFTDEGRLVTRVSLQDIDEDSVELQIDVEDSGIGISKKDQESLFRAFSQIESSNTRRFSGTGLGLVISQNLASLMGGKISMESEPASGSRFSLNLPFRLAPATAGDPTASSQSPSTLIFASEENNLMEIRTLFDRAGAFTEAQLVTAENGLESIETSVQATGGKLDLVVLDLRRLDIELEALIPRIGDTGLRIIAMHYDPGYELPFQSDRIEFVSVITTSRKIRELLSRNTEHGKQLPSKSVNQTVGSKHVLLVDDNQINLKLASELIRLWGHRVTEADHADTAFELYREHAFDLIVLDIQMPDIDGVSLLHMMRDLKPDDQTPIAALTANVLNHEAERLLDLGFDYFLGKPIDETQFRALLDGQPMRKPAAVQPELEQNPVAREDLSLDYERSLELAAGNESLFKQILEILKRDIPEQRQHLRDALDDQDLDRLGALAHKLHGVTCYASLPKLRRLVVAFQQTLTTASSDSLASSVDELDSELAAVLESVMQHLERIQQVV